MERFMKAAGVEFTHVPYKGGAGQAIPAMVAGEVQLAFFNMASLLPHIKSGRLKAARRDSHAAAAELPNVPTLAEQGYPGIGTNAWQGMFAPAGTPKPVVDKLYASVAVVRSDAPDQREGLAEADDECRTCQNRRGIHRPWCARETQDWGEFLRAARIKLD